MKRILIALAIATITTSAAAKPKVCEHYKTYTADDGSKGRIAICFDTKRPRLVTGNWSLVEIAGKTVLLEVDE